MFENKKSLIIFSFFILLAGLGIVYIPGYIFLSLLLFGLLTFLLYKKIEYGIFFLIIYTPFESFLLKFAPDEIYTYARFLGEIILLACFVNFIIYYFVDKDSVNRLDLKNKKIILAIFAPLLLFFLTYISSSLVNQVPAFIALAGIRQFFRYLLLFIILSFIKPGKRFYKRITEIMIGLVLIEIVIAFLQVIFPGLLDNLLLDKESRTIGTAILVPAVKQLWIKGERVFATLGRYDRLGTFLGFFILLALGFLYQLKNKRDKLILKTLVVLGCLTLIFTYSRTAWLGVLVGFSVMALAIKKDKRVAKVLLVGLLILGVYFSAYIAYKNINIQAIENSYQMSLTQRVLQSISKSELLISYYNFGRIYFIVNTLERVVRQYPLLGVGPGMYGGGVASYLYNTQVYDRLGLAFGVEGTAGQIDNNVFSIWGEVGTLGLVFFIWLTTGLFYIAYKLYERSQDRFASGLALGYLGGIILWLIAGFLGPHFEIRTLALYFWLYGGIITALYLKDDKIIIKKYVATN